MTTRRFGLTDTPDLRLVDGVLSALEVHDHSGGDRLLSPSAPADAFLATSGGQLPGSSTYSYRWSLVDQFGFETAASNEVSVSTPEVIAAPGTPVVTAAQGGQLEAGLYSYYLTALADTEETELSQPAMITLVPGESAVVIEAPLVRPTGVTGYRVWRQAPGAYGQTRVAVFSGLSYTDDGTVPDDACACDPGNLPPAFNRTNSTSRVTITLPDVALPLLADPRVNRWRLYRTTVAGVYSSSSLLAEVVTRPVTPGPLTEVYVDDGTAQPVAGSPSEVAQTLLPSIKIKAGGGATSLVVGDPGGNGWKVYADTNGTLVTRSTSVPPSGAVLLDSDNARWRLTASSTGALEIASDAVASTLDNVYTVVDPPVLPTPDPTYVYALLVVQGALATQEA